MTQSAWKSSIDVARMSHRAALWSEKSEKWLFCSVGGFTNRRFQKIIGKQWARIWNHMFLQTGLWRNIKACSSLSPFCASTPSNVFVKMWRSRFVWKTAESNICMLKRNKPRPEFSSSSKSSSLPVILSPSSLEEIQTSLLFHPRDLGSHLCCCA